MAHELSEINGIVEAMYAEKPAWHGLGKVLDHAATSEEAIREAHLDWEVEKWELEAVNPKHRLQIRDKMATVRTDVNHVLAVVGDGYEVVQNLEAFAFLDSLMMDGVMKYESAGALQGGKKIWVLARMPSIDTIAEGDDCLRYALWTSGHDGLTKIHCIPTSVRVVCANTLRMALEGIGGGIMHTTSVRDRLEKAKQFLSQFDEKFTLFRDHGRLLATRQYTKQQARDYIEELFPTPKEEGKGATIRERKVEAVRQALRHDTSLIKSIRGTFWALANAVTASVDHKEVKSTPRSDAQRRNRAEKRFENLIEGPAADFKNRAFQLAFDMAGISTAV